MSVKQTQLDKFKQAAKELECDVNETTFNKNLKAISTNKSAKESSAKTQKNP